MCLLEMASCSEEPILGVPATYLIELSLSSRPTERADNQPRGADEGSSHRSRSDLVHQICRERPFTTGAGDYGAIRPFWFHASCTIGKRREKCCST